MSMLQVKGVVKELQGVKVVDDVSFAQEYKQKLAIAGETGSGKSTLLKMLCGWVQPDAGEMLFNGERIIGPEDQLLPGHKGIAYLSQHFEYGSSSSNNFGAAISKRAVAMRCFSPPDNWSVRLRSK